jgi:hypothetical protein
MTNQPDEPAPVKRPCTVWETGPGEQRAAAADAHYCLAPLPSDHGRAFRLRKLEADGGEAHVVDLAADGPTCSCPGHSYRGACKHLDALLALQAQGKLDAIPAPPRPAAGPASGAAPAPQATPGGAGQAPPPWDDL